MNTVIEEAERKVVVIQLLQQSYGVNISDINSIERLPAITNPPQIEPFVKGIINLRANKEGTCYE